MAIRQKKQPNKPLRLTLTEDKTCRLIGYKVGNPLGPVLWGHQLMASKNPLKTSIHRMTDPLFWRLSRSNYAKLANPPKHVFVTLNSVFNFNKPVVLHLILCFFKGFNFTDNARFNFLTNYLRFLALAQTPNQYFIYSKTKFFYPYSLADFHASPEGVWFNLDLRHGAAGNWKKTPLANTLIHPNL